MKKYNGKFPNVTIYVLSLITIIFAIKTMNAKIESGISIVVNTKFIFGIPALIIGIVSTVLLSYLLVSKKKVENLEKYRYILKVILIVFVSVYAAEYTLFSFLRAIEHALTLTKIPEKSQFLNSMAFIVIDYAPDFLRGVFVTLQLSLIGTIIGLMLGLIFVIFRTLKITSKDNELIAFLKKIGVVVTKTYVNVFRGTPMMVQAVIIYYLLPYLIATQFGIEQSQVDKFFTLTIAGIVIVSLNTTAYLTEVLRGGIESIDKGQLEAARSLGMGYWQSMFSIILPQAIKNSLPSIGNEFIINIKDTSVLNVIGVAELFFQAQDAKYRYYRTYEPFIIVALVYLFLTMTTSKVLAWIEKKMNLDAKPIPSSN